MNATNTPTMADRKRRPSPRALLHRHLNSLKRHGGLAPIDGCLCNPRAYQHARGEHWIAARDPRDGALVWSWIKLRDGVALSAHDLTPDEVTRALEVWLVRKDTRRHNEYERDGRSASEAVHA